MKNVLITKFEPLDYAATEAINTLCANLTFSGAGIKKIMITSSQASEGKTLTTMNMMRTFAALGKTVVYVSGDLRRSPIVQTYGIRFESDDTVGITHYLAGMASAAEVVYQTNIPGAYLVPVGRDVSNSLSLLSTPRLPALLDYLASMFDIVLVDSPPIGVIIDAAEIAKSCDGTVLVVNYNSVRRRELSEARRQIERAGCPILGAVLNEVPMDSYSNRRYYNQGYYSQYYSSTSGSSSSLSRSSASGKRRKNG